MKRRGSSFVNARTAQARCSIHGLVAGLLLLGLAACGGKDDSAEQDDCRKGANKFRGRPVTSPQTPITGSALANVTDGSYASGSTVNFPAFSASVSIDLGSRQCLTEIIISAAMTPTGTVSQHMLFRDASGATVADLDFTRVMLDHVPTTFTLPSPVWANSVTLEVRNSPSWVGWSEIEGY